MPTRLTSWAAPLRAYSVLNSATSTADAPRPPYSTGQLIPTQPAAASFACQARPQAMASARSSVSGGVSVLSVNQARASAAKRSSASVSDRSTGAASEVPGLGATGLHECLVEGRFVAGGEGPVGVLAAPAHVNRVSAGAVGAEFLMDEGAGEHLVGGRGGQDERHPDVAGSPLGAEVGLGVEPGGEAGGIE